MASQNIFSGKRIGWIGAFMLSIFLASPVWAAGMKVGFVNMQKAVASTQEFKNELKKFRVAFEKEKKIIASREKKMQKMLNDLNKQSFVLDPALKKKKEDNFLKEKKKFERYVQDRNDEFAKREQEITNRILKKMLKILKRIGKKKKLSMIIEKKSVFYSDASSDLTNLATKTYDKTHK